MFFSVFYSQEDSIKYNSVYVGIDIHIGFGKPKELISNEESTILMKRGFSPKIGYMYQMSKKTKLFFDIGYNFLTSSRYDTVIDNKEICFLKRSRGPNVAILFDYYVRTKPMRDLAVNFGLSVNNFNEFIELNNEDLNKPDNYSKVAFKIGVSYIPKANFNTLIRFFYKRQGKK